MIDPPGIPVLYTAISLQAIFSLLLKDDTWEDEDEEEEDDELTMTEQGLLGQLSDFTSGSGLAGMSSLLFLWHLFVLKVQCLVNICHVCISPASNSTWA